MVKLQPSGTETPNEEDFHRGAVSRSLEAFKDLEVGLNFKQ